VIQDGSQGDFDARDSGIIPAAREHTTIKEERERDGRC